MNNLTNFIRLVLSQSKLAMEKGEIPVASLIVDPIDESVIARSFNQEITLNDPTAHAEICLLYTSPSPRDATLSRMPSSA